MMNKVEYLDVLNDYLLKYYSEEESLDILRDYEEYFLNGKLDGKTEQEIILELGSPKIIVQELRAEEKNVSKKQGVFLNLSKKFDRWFEKGLSDGYSNREIEIMEIKCDKVIPDKGREIFDTPEYFIHNVLFCICISRCERHFRSRI